MPAVTTTTPSRKPVGRRKGDDLLDNVEIGPAMRALCARHREAVRLLFELKGNRTAVFKALGYGNPKNPKYVRNIQAESSKFFADKRIRAAIREEITARLDSGEVEIFEGVRSIANDTEERATDRLRALGMLWDRARPVETKHRIEVEHSVTNDERDMQHYVAMKRIGAPEDAFVRRFGVNGIARVEALVAAEEERRRQLDGPIIDAQLEDAVDAR
jgi:hypothetical protein